MLLLLLRVPVTRSLRWPAWLVLASLLPLGCAHSSSPANVLPSTPDATSFDGASAEASAPITPGAGLDAAAGAWGSPDAMRSDGSDGGASKVDARGDGGQTVPPTVVASVKLSDPRQIIDGFGVSNAWISAPDPSIKTAVYDALFSLSKGAGLSILRNRIPFRENPMYDDQFLAKNADGTYLSTTNPDGSKTFTLNWSNWDLTNTSALLADIAAKGADYQVTKLLSTPWTPPNDSVNRWKLSDANKTIDYVSKPEQGGYLDPVHYADYADVLAQYALGYKAKMGVDLTALSLQNEPNFQAAYESADWSAQQFHDFLAVLKAEFTKKGVFAQLPNLQIAAPEDANFKEGLLVPTLSDPAVAGVVGIVAGHQYEFGPSNASSYAPPVLAVSSAAGKHLWMTEWSTAAWATDASIADGLVVARLIDEDLTLTNANAFFYWWAWGTGNGVLVVLPTKTSYVVPKRLFAMGQYSRFVRPGWRRVGTVDPPGVLLAAFEDPGATRVAVVAIHAGPAPTSFSLALDAGRFVGLTVTRTSATEDLANV
ncbi:MAG: hypothetical protein M3O36_21155, partial [Myxococcota bacterium]|nr:hypothetical protein [Myxococcota bacterium]